MLVFFGSEKAPKFLERQLTWNRAPVKGPEVERDAAFRRISADGNFDLDGVLTHSRLPAT